MTQTTKLYKVFFSPCYGKLRSADDEEEEENNSDKVQLIPKKKMYVDYKREKNRKEKEVVGAFQINMANVFILNVEMTRRRGGHLASLSSTHVASPLAHFRNVAITVVLLLKNRTSSFPIDAFPM